MKSYMSRRKVKENLANNREELFHKWKELSMNISYMNYIVQNPVPISREEINNWDGVVSDVVIELNKLHVEIKVHLIEGLEKNG